ncbi:hypothetical protein BLOT_009374 [Blomia tropicalis]|nr:hypothetical protein BLOT_009374 [Blomia tropicalis]
MLLMAAFTASTIANPTNSSGCGLNARTVECGSNCPVNCGNKDNQPSICNFACFVGCRCQEGYIFKDGNSGDCVKPEDCSK